MDVEMIVEFFADYTYHNQYGWNVVGSVDTGECEFPRVKIVVSNFKCFYSIAWDGRQPKMAEWATIETAVVQFVRMRYPTHCQNVQFAHSTR